MKYSVKIGSVWGIPIELHLTFVLLMVAVFVLSYPQFYLFVLVLFLFVFVVVHELSHSAIAKHYGIKVRKIVLYPLGGVSEIEELSESPSIEWRVAIAGPITSFAIGVLLFASDWILMVEAPATSFATSFSTTGRLILDLGVLNLLLGGFNLIPAFPMDGGRILRAFLAERMNFSDATKYAAFLGRLMGIAIAVFGFLHNFWLILIGVFVYIGATEEAESTIVSTTLARVRVKDVMLSETATVGPEMTLADALETMFKSRYHDALVEQDGKLEGIVTWSEIMKVKPEQRSELRVSQLPLFHISAFPEESVLEVHKVMLKEKVDLVPVVEKDRPGKVVGVLTSEGVAYSYQKARSLR